MGPYPPPSPQDRPNPPGPVPLSRGSRCPGKRLLGLTVLLLGLLAATPLAAREIADPPDYAEPEAVRDYQAARAGALGMAVVGFLVGVAGAAASADRPEHYLQYRRLVLLCGLAFTVITLDRMLIQGVAGWFQVAPAALPPWWR